MDDFDDPPALVAGARGSETTMPTLEVGMTGMAIGKVPITIVTGKSMLSRYSKKGETSCRAFDYHSLLYPIPAAVMLQDLRAERNCCSHAAV